MNRQSALSKRIDNKARSIIRAGGIHQISDYVFLMPSMSELGKWHHVTLEWVRDRADQILGLRGTCVLAANGQLPSPCLGDVGGSVCWHILAAIIKASKRKKVMFFASYGEAEAQGKPIPVVGKGIWFVVDGGK